MSKRRQDRRPCLRGLAVALAVLASAACGSAPPAALDAVVIGATLPISGPDAARSTGMKRGYERAVAAVNATGGLRIGTSTVPVRLDLRDDTTDAATLEGLTRSLIDAGAHVILATPGDVRAVAEASVTEASGIPLIGNPVDHAGLPGKRMQWMVLVAASEPDSETRAHDVLTTTLAAISSAGSVDPRAIRTALQALRPTP